MQNCLHENDMKRMQGSEKCETTEPGGRKQLNSVKNSVKNI